MRVRVLKLGTVCKDRATKLEGTLTHWIIEMDQHIVYLFQPRGLDENRMPVKKLLLGVSRLETEEGDFETVEIPFEILGTKVADKASGFAGMAVQFVRHINGCFHVSIQPEGLIERTGLPIAICDFDLRQCTGDKIIELSETALAESRMARPSPTGDSFERQMPSSISESAHRP